MDTRDGSPQPRPLGVAALNDTARSRGCILFQKFDGIADSQDPRRVVVRNVATKFLLKGHYYFNDIKAVGAEVIKEARAVNHFIGIDSKLFNHDLSNSFSNLAHLSSPIPHFLPGAAGVKSAVQRRSSMEGVEGSKGGMEQRRDSD